ncbi:thioesterase family protein [Actinacidiphila oryziradicis]|uniref:Thioesterase family protein n=1 Tax=Actinacidiphila oryziradicis TaxID=2571141 RepID=A0A4U0SPW0_9ACTN|nr:thioesterase family protein [Actinacidiphila oryziradicis]TKA12110.1 thioesterase family protein [Actinacidiphila oryziradicis]
MTLHTYGFDLATTVTPRPDEPSVFDAELHDNWRIGMGINGGLLLALAGRALCAELGDGVDGHLDPFSISGYYLSPTSPGRATLRTETLRRGRTVSTGSVSLTQAGDDGEPVERVRVLATYGDLDGHTDHIRTSATPPDLPAPADCVSTDLAPPEFLKQAPFLGSVELRLDPGTIGWVSGTPSGRGMARGWFRLPDGREPDPLMLLLAVDVLPPVNFDLGVPSWAPTLELTVHVRAKPAPGWLRIVHSTRNFAGGYLEEDAEAWDSAGRLVAQSRQLARVRLPQ